MFVVFVVKVIKGQEDVIVNSFDNFDDTHVLNEKCLVSDTTSSLTKTINTQNVEKKTGERDEELKTERCHIERHVFVYILSVKKSRGKSLLRNLRKSL